MKANQAFLDLPKGFWAHVRSISEAQQYTDRRTGGIKALDVGGIVAAFRKLRLSCDHLVFPDGSLTDFGLKLCQYFEYRAHVLDNFVQCRLMDATMAEKVYSELKAALQPRLAPTMNKQSGDMKKPAYLTGIVNMIIESKVGHQGFNSNPGQLTTFTHNSMPLRTLSRRVDGALPGIVNPVAIWEIKEYYWTTTFGSRVADGVYETLLDGMELEEMREHEGRNVQHMLALDAHYTWWVKGRSYLCRIIDMLHMGYVDEALFGYEVVERLPGLVDEWIEMARDQYGYEPQIRGDESAEDDSRESLI